MEKECDLIRHGVDDLAQVHTLIPLRCVSLNLHGNKLLSLHGLPKLSLLRDLDLSSNEIVTCDLPELGQLPSLRSLDLSANRIDSLAALPFLPGLRSLSVAFNSLKSLAGVGSENVPDLESLDARGNFLAAAPQLRSLSSLTRLRALALGGRQPNPICDNAPAMLALLDEYPRLQTLDGAGCDEWREMHGILMGSSNGRQREDEGEGEEEEKSNVSSVSAGHSFDSEVSTPKFDELSRRFKAHRLGHRDRGRGRDREDKNCEEPTQVVVETNLAAIVSVEVPRHSLSQQSTQTEDGSALVPVLAPVLAPTALALASAPALTPAPVPAPASAPIPHRASPDAPSSVLMTPGEWLAFATWANHVVIPHLDRSLGSKDTPGTEGDAPAKIAAGVVALATASEDPPLPSPRPLPSPVPEPTPEAFRPPPCNDPVILPPPGPEPTSMVSQPEAPAGMPWRDDGADAQLQQQLEHQKAEQLAVEAAAALLKGELCETRALMEEAKAAAAMRVLQERQRADAASKKLLASAVQASALRREAGEQCRRAEALEVRLDEAQRSHIAREEASAAQLAELEEGLAKEARAREEAAARAEALAAQLAAQEEQRRALDEVGQRAALAIQGQLAAAKDGEASASLQLREAREQQKQTDRAVAALREQLSAAEWRRREDQARAIALEESDRRSLEEQRARLEGEFLHELQSFIRKRDEREAQMQLDHDAARKALTDQLAELALCVCRLQQSLKAATRSNKELRRQQEAAGGELQAREAAMEAKLEAAGREMTELVQLLEAAKRPPPAQPAPAPPAPIVIDLDLRKDGQIAELQLQLAVKTAQLTDQGLDISGLKARLVAQAQASQAQLDELEREAAAERAERLALGEELQDAFEALEAQERQADKWRLLARAAQAYQQEQDVQGDVSMSI